MLKFTLALTTLLFSMSAGSNQPASSDKWSRVKEIVFKSPSTTQRDGLTVDLHLHYDNKLLMEIRVTKINGTVLEDVCKTIDVTRLTKNWYVNGKAIIYTAECDDKTLRVRPESDIDTKYMVDEFLTKQLVHVGPNSFSTNGFIEGYSEVVRYASYIN